MYVCIYIYEAGESGQTSHLDRRGGVNSHGQRVRGVHTQGFLAYSVSLAQPPGTRGRGV